MMPFLYLTGVAILLFGGGCEDDLVAVVAGNIHHPYHMFHVNGFVHVEGEGGVGHIHEFLLEFPFQVFKAYAFLFHIKLQVSGNGYCGGRLGRRLVVALGQQQLECVGGDHGGGDHKEYEQQEHQVGHGRHAE